MSNDDPNRLNKKEMSLLILLFPYWFVRALIDWWEYER